jgi:hypothetical protein
MRVISSVSRRERARSFAVWARNGGQVRVVVHFGDRLTAAIQVVRAV